jgi:hypothetical protein
MICTKQVQEFLPRILDFKIFWVEHLVQGHIPSLRRDWDPPLFIKREKKIETTSKNPVRMSTFPSLFPVIKLNAI